MIVARTGARYMPPTPFRAPRDPMASTWPCLLCTFTLWHLLLIRLCSQMLPLRSPCTRSFAEGCVRTAPASPRACMS